MRQRFGYALISLGLLMGGIGGLAVLVCGVKEIILSIIGDFNLLTVIWLAFKTTITAATVTVIGCIPGYFGLWILRQD